MRAVAGSGDARRVRRRFRRPVAAGLALATASTAGAVALTTTGRLPATPGPAPARSSASATTAPAPPPVLLPAGPSPAGLPPAGPSPAYPTRAATTAGIAAAIGPLLRAAPLRGGVGAVVIDAADGRVLLDRGGGTGRAPASLAKLTTGAAALASLDPTSRLHTRVVSGVPGEIVLVGAGDPTLVAATPARTAYPRPASLDELARRTAAAVLPAMRPRGPIAALTVRVDDGLFVGPAVSPDWEPGYVRAGVVAPVSALTLDDESPAAAPAGRVPDPALATGRRFVALLRARGVPVRPEVTHATVRAGMEGTLAEVASPPVAVLVESALRRSDNDLAEALARLVAVREGRPATFAGAAAAVTDVLRRLGVPTGGLRLLDGSGAARGSRVPPRALAAVLELAAEPGSRVGGLLSGLPVAGFSGTLELRYVDRATAAGAGAVRAKTGSLTGASGLAGVVGTADRGLLVFVVLADRVPPRSTGAARNALDRVGAALATCGCR